MIISIEVDGVSTEYTIKTRQAIEILDLAEKSKLLERVKQFTAPESKKTILDMLEYVPLGYKVAAEILSLAMGKVEKGKVIPNTELADEIEATKMPFYAMQVIRTLMLPISYVITGDPTMEEEKKKDLEENSDTKPGMNESSTEPVES